MNDENDYAKQEELLATYRRRLAYLLRQRAIKGVDAPFELDENIRDSRVHIGSIKIALRNSGYTVTDHPGDIDDPELSHQPSMETNQEKSVTVRPQVQDMMNLANQYNHIFETYQKGRRDKQMAGVFQEMKDGVLKIPHLDISSLLKDIDPGKKLIVYAYLSVKPDIQFLDELVQSATLAPSTDKGKHPFVQHQGIIAIGAIVDAVSHNQVPVWLCERLKFILTTLPSSTIRHAELQRIIKHIC